jgi:hypothetical protein
MQDTLNAKIADLHVFLYGGLLNLPFALGGTMLIIGLFTSNYAVLFFLIGLLVVAPFGAWAVNHVIPIICNCFQYVFYFIVSMIAGDDYARKFQPSNTFVSMSYFNTKIYDICGLIIPFGDSKNSSTKMETIISSQWMAMSSFFIGYILCNSLELYNNNEISSASLNVPNAPDTQMKVNKRRSQAMFALVSIAIFGLIILGFRCWTGCERIIGIILTGVGFGAAGYYWYQLLSEVGQGRLSDIFGIANRLLVPSAIKNGPIACVPIPAP